MPSPFPGMDPYLESPAIWSDLHLTLIVAMRAELNASLPAGYLAAADRHIWIEDEDEYSAHLVEPDGFVVEAPTTGGQGTAATAASALAPRIVTLPLLDRKGKPFLKIIDKQDRRVVTVVELLSPANKTPGKLRNSYLAKREEYLAANVNVIEINLLRSGKTPPLGKARSPKGAYYYLVCLAEELPKARLWTFGVRDSLPPVLVPLLGDDAVSLNLR
ncbi:MAG: DUF4058 family protein, partial [Planctomycetes bacterium]|nr:DUF4058 family protein [Planctomycetota bacterium]